MSINNELKKIAYRKMIAKLRIKGDEISKRKASALEKELDSLIQKELDCYDQSNPY